MLAIEFGTWWELVFTGLRKLGLEVAGRRAHTHGGAPKQLSG